MWEEIEMKIISRTYSRHTKAIYAKAVPLDEGEIEKFMLAFSSSEGGVTGEFEISCGMLSGEEVFRIKCFGDSIDELLGFSDVLAKLSAVDKIGKSIADEIENILKSCSISDATITTTKY